MVNQVQYVKDTFNEYLGKKDHISASDIKNFLKSPKYYYWNKYLKTEKEDGRHFAIGSAIHELILEPQLFLSNYIVMPKVDKRTKDGKLQYEQFMIEAQSKTMLDSDEMVMITEMVKNATDNKTFMALLENSHRELSAYLTDEKTGLKLKVRPDILPQTKSTIIDIKSCIDSSPKKFKGDVYSYGYSLSAAYYCDLLKRENYIFAAIEKSQPYQTSLYALSDEMMEYGRQQYRMGLDLLKWSYDNNYWCDHNEFEILKESYSLENLEQFFEINELSTKITILQ
jgi:exodeoxyribonuclease VIII